MFYSKLYLYHDEKNPDAFQILSAQDRATFSYNGKPVRFNVPVEYKDGVVYQTLNDKFAAVVTSVSDEASARVSSDADLTDRIYNEELARASADAKLESDLSAEATTRSINDTSFNQALANETLAHQTADNLNATNITIEKNRAEAYEASLNIMINSEATRALGIEGGLRTDLNIEIADRKSAISTEQKVRSDADIALDVKIGAETTRATSVEVANFQLLDCFIATERTRAIAKENSLKTQLNFFVANVDPVGMDSLPEIVSKLNSAGSDLYQRVLHLESVVGNLRNNPLYPTDQQTFTPGIVPRLLQEKLTDHQGDRPSEPGTWS